MTTPAESSAESKFLARAIELAERGRASARPNPLVGAVVVKDGEIVGEGWHEGPGTPHAEAAAVAAAGDRARGATVYVTLEPCAHHGRTPPCADALVAARVARVVAAAQDPHRLVDGRGFARLREGGVEVELAQGELAVVARRQNEAFLTWAAEGRPFVVYKAAVTLDGRLAAAGGDARWVSGEASRRRVHELRAAVDAVAVGMGTVRADNPRLTARDVGATRQPRRIAFGQGPLPAGSDLELLSGDLAEELTRLAEDDVQLLLLEGGPTLAAAFLRRDLIDKLLLFVAPKLVGGDDAPPLFAGPAVRSLASAVSAPIAAVERIGDDLLVTAYIHEP